MKKNSVISLLLICVLLSFSCKQKQAEKIAKLEEKISLLETEVVPMKFKIKEKNGDKIRLAVQFYDVSTAKPVAKGEFETSGSEVHFDFQVRKVNSQYLIFPYSVFSDTIAPSDGEKIYDLYSSDGFPEIYAGMNLDGVQKLTLKEIFTKSMEDSVTTEESSKISVHDLKNHSAFRKNIEYKVIFHPSTGAVEIL